MKVLLCIDIGGTKTAVGIFSEKGSELFYSVIPTEPRLGVADLIERLKTVINVGYGTSDFLCGCIASPGPLDTANGRIIDIATMGWRDIPLTLLFEEAFKCSFLLINDCNAGALGVWERYKADNMLYVSMSTGVGGGLIIGGKLYEGCGNAAEIGHIRVPGEGRKCSCGRTDCLELYSSGSGISRVYGEKTGKNLSAKEIAESAFAKDAIAVELFDDAAEKLNYALLNIDKLLDLDLIVLGGGLTAASDLYYNNAVKGIENKTVVLKGDGKQVLRGAFVYIKRFIHKISKKGC